MGPRSPLKHVSLFDKGYESTRHLHGRGGGVLFSHGDVLVTLLERESGEQRVREARVRWQRGKGAPSRREAPLQRCPRALTLTGAQGAECGEQIARALDGVRWRRIEPRERHELCIIDATPARQREHHGGKISLGHLGRRLLD